MLGYIINLSPFLEIAHFIFWGFHFDFFSPCFLTVLGCIFFFSFFQLRTHLIDSNIGSRLAWGPSNHLTCPSVGGNPWLGQTRKEFNWLNWANKGHFSTSKTVVKWMPFSIILNAYFLALRTYVPNYKFRWLLKNIFFLAQKGYQML